MFELGHRNHRNADRFEAFVLTQRTRGSVIPDVSTGEAREPKSIELSFPYREELWAQAIADVLGPEAAVSIDGRAILPNPIRTEVPVIDDARPADLQVLLAHPHFCGPGRRSPNGRYGIIWHPDKSGAWRLTDRGNVVLHGECSGIYDGHVCDEGVFVVCSQLNGSDVITIKELDGSDRMSFSTGFPILASGVSLDGRVVAFYSGDRIYAHFHDRSPSIEFEPVRSNVPARIEINSSLKEFRLIYEGNGVHRYGFDGTFYDGAAWRNERLTVLSGYELFQIATKLLDNPSPETPEVVVILDTVLKKGVSNWTLAESHRLLGECHRRDGRTAAAIEHFEKALEFNPKAPVKRAITRLEKMRHAETG